MTTPTLVPSFDTARLEPLETDEQIVARASELIGRANLRQLWLLFLDDEAVQLPLLVPIDGLPLAPARGDADRVFGALADLMQEVGAASIILVWERYASERLTPTDLAWRSELLSACAAQGVTVRAMLLSHRGGIRMLAADE